jgi:hypothetical protein
LRSRCDGDHRDALFCRSQGSSLCAGPVPTASGETSCFAAGRARRDNAFGRGTPSRGGAISDPMRELIEDLWPELVHKLPPKSVRLHDLWAGTENYVSIGRPSLATAAQPSGGDEKWSIRLSNRTELRTQMKSQKFATARHCRRVPASVPNVLQVPARVRQALDGSRLLPVPPMRPVCRGASRPPLSRQRSSLLMLSL